eukprot:TRINITY_DN41711_c0_g1_i1.p1 TRINITY_DN41711_c0_g1~~TRINITY_DN41711_c0_g1_i1.p1  ORF type:complete len:610 (-),score=129.72 TRINITY_DN41711_c0_g1_i1:86-1915(-)
MVEHSRCRGSGGRCTRERSVEEPCTCRVTYPDPDPVPDIHKRNVSTVASPVILMFSGLHNLVYQIYLTSRYLLSMGCLLLRIALHEIIKPTGEKNHSDPGSAATNITENKLADYEGNPECVAGRAVQAAVISYSQEAGSYAIQHRVNKLKQHHRRAFDLISKALKIDEEVGNRDVRTVEMYKKGINELERGILLDFNCGSNKECHQAKKLQHKMKLNLDMAKKRLDYHQLNQNRKSQSVLKHLSLPRNMKAPAQTEVINLQKPSSRRDKGPYTPQPTRKSHKRCMSGSDTLPRNHRVRTNSTPSLSSREKKSDNSKFMAVVMNEIIEDGTSCCFSEVAGQHSAKQALQETVILPALRPELFTGLRTPTRGLLLFGPPGNGKTMLARAVASESDSAFFNISASTLTSKFVGEGEKLVRALFTAARQTQPSIIFIDEIDSLLCERSDTEHEASRRLKTEFLLEFDGLRGQADDKMLVMGATNRPQDLDDAVLRRFSKRIYVRLPNKEDRLQLLDHLLKQQYNDLTMHEIHQIAQLTPGYSGSDLANLARDAAYGPIRELRIDEVKSLDPVNLRKVDMSDFLESMKKIKKSVSPDSLVPYETWNQKFGEGSS